MEKLNVLLSICLLVILSLSLHHTFYQLGFLVDFLKRRLFKPLIQRSLLLASDVKSVIWWIPTFISLSSQELDYKVTLKLLGAGQLTKGETILLSVWEAQLRVRARMYSLLTTLIQNKKLRYLKITLKFMTKLMNGIRQALVNVYNQVVRLS